MTEQTPRRSVRNDMPKVMAWIDGLREAFGADLINGQVRAGMQGIPGFHASEAGHEIGTRPVQRGTEISAAQMVLLVPKK